MFEIQSLGVFIWIVPIFFLIQCTKKNKPKSLASSAKSRKSAVELKPASAPKQIQKSVEKAVESVKKQTSVKEKEKKSSNKEKAVSAKKASEKRLKTQNAASEKKKKTKTVEDKMETAAEDAREANEASKNKDSVNEQQMIGREEYVPTDEEARVIYVLDKTMKENVFNPVINPRARATRAESYPNAVFLDYSKTVYKGNIDQGEIHEEFKVDLYKEMRSDVEKAVKEHEEQLKSKSKKSEVSEKADSVHREAGRLIYREENCKLHECKQIISEEDEEGKGDEAG